MIGGAGASFISVSLACVYGEQQQQARGKGRMPEAGPRHGAAGLWVTPEYVSAPLVWPVIVYGGRPCARDQDVKRADGDAILLRVNACRAVCSAGDRRDLRRAVCRYSRYSRSRPNPRGLALPCAVSPVCVTSLAC